MNIITVSDRNNVSDRHIYSDLMRKFRNEGHQVYIVSPAERRSGQKTHVFDTDCVKILKVNFDSRTIRLHNFSGVNHITQNIWK